MDHNLSGHNHGIQPYYDIALDEKKKKKKKKPATGGGGGSVGVVIACAIGGAMLSRGIRYATVKFLPMSNDDHKRGIADGVSTVIGGTTAFVFKNPYLKNIGAGMVAEAVTDGGMLAIEIFSKEPAMANSYTSDSSESMGGTDDYEDDLQGTDDYEDVSMEGTDDEALTTVDLSGFMDIGDTGMRKPNKDYW